MHRTTLVTGLALAAVVLIGGWVLAQAPPPQNPAADHARRVLQLLGEDNFAAVARAGSAQGAAAMTAPQLRELWSNIRQQVGPLTSVIDQRVTTPASGITAVVLGCQFEKSALNVMVAFDADQKIAGL